MVPAPPDRESSVAESSCIVLSLSVPGHRDRFLVDIDHACVYNKERPVVFIITGEPGGGKPIRRAWWGQAPPLHFIGLPGASLNVVAGRQPPPHPPTPHKLNYQKTHHPRP